MRKSKTSLLSIVLLIASLLAACAESSTTSSIDSSSTSTIESIEESIESTKEIVPEISSEDIPDSSLKSDDYSKEELVESNNEPQSIQQLPTPPFALNDIPQYSGEPYVVINGNIPYFSENDLTTESFEYYSDLDSFGRCGVAYASIGLDLMPTEERESIGQIKPTGWHTVKYNDVVDGNYLYNRCHLIGYQLSGENANERNLITGTRYLNVQGMLPFENMVADYVKETGSHVLYRVTPVFEGDNLLSSGVLMEAKSVEDAGDGILFCVFAYNVQPNIDIDYVTGESSLSESYQTPEPPPEPTPEPTVVPTPKPEAPIVQESTEEPIPQGTTYIINTNTGKFHYTTCGSVKQMKEENKWQYSGTRDEIVSMGYVPCKKCNP